MLLHTERPPTAVVQDRPEPPKRIEDVSMHTNGDELYSLANCGIHYGWYHKANVIGGDVPCEKGCASKVWGS